MCRYVHINTPTQHTIDKDIGNMTALLLDLY